MFVTILWGNRAVKAMRPSEHHIGTDVLGVLTLVCCAAGLAVVIQRVLVIYCLFGCSLLSPVLLLRSWKLMVLHQPLKFEL